MAANQPTVLHTETGSLDFIYDPGTLSHIYSAADTFIKHTGGSTEIWAASRDWFLEEWGRDTFISLPGLLLTSNRFDEAKQVFRRFAKFERGGLIPNVIRGDQLHYNTTDASLWFIHALKAYLEVTHDWSFASELLPTIRNIIAGYTHGTSYEHAGRTHGIGADQEDGLIVSPPQATWMDADPAGDGTTIMTPRNGKCVEINALWYGALRFVATAEKQLDPAADVAELEKSAEQVRASFTSKFWNEQAGCLSDCLEGDPHGAAIRPNQVIAISHGGDILDPEKQQQVLNVVERDLLTPGGLRTLSPRDSQYQAHYNTYDPTLIKDQAYHQGTVWPWLIGPYCDALIIVRNQQNTSNPEVQDGIGRIIAPLVRFCLDSEFHSLPEVFSGDPPYEPGGTTAQAWSVAEMLRVLTRLTSNQ